MREICTSGLTRGRTSAVIGNASHPVAFSLLYYFYALSLPDVHISVLSLFRRCSCVITFIVGAYVFHDINMRRKAYALLVILTGAVIIALNK